MHWVSAAHAVPAEVRLYDPLFNRPDPGADGDFLADLNPNSLEVLADARLEPSLAAMNAGAAVTTTAWQALMTNCFGVRCSQGGLRSCRRRRPRGV